MKDPWPPLASGTACPMDPPCHDRVPVSASELWQAVPADASTGAIGQALPRLVPPRLPRLCGAPVSAAAIPDRSDYDPPPGDTLASKSACFEACFEALGRQAKGGR
eukprot:scaffold125788_cov72-Phaeocystis_antarctica.AAC.1